jgi:hypothetical protein
MAFPSLEFIGFLGSKRFFPEDPVLDTIVQFLESIADYIGKINAPEGEILDSTLVGKLIPRIQSPEKCH